MLYRRGWGHATAIVVTALTLGAGTASAEVRFIDPSTGLCQSAAAAACSTDSDCEAAGHTCETVYPGGVETRVCRPPRAAICCSDSSTDAKQPCPPAMSCQTLVLSSLLVANLCVPEGRTYCGNSAEHLRQCHTGPRDLGPPAYPLAYEHGDCDGDGIPNGVDGTPCEGPPLIGIVDGHTCDTMDVVGCAEGKPCEGGTCELLAGGSATYCRPAHEVLFCCPDDVCPGSRTCHAFNDTLSVCIPPECAGNLACVTDGAGNPVPVPEGDCDEDGVTNRHSSSARAGFCPLPDGGVPSPDAGPPTARDAGPSPARDAGPTSDASAGFDGGSNVPVAPSFAGGGGCVCRSAPGRSGSAAWLALAPLALLLAARRR